MWEVARKELMCVGDIFSLYQIYDLVFSLYSLHPKEIYQQAMEVHSFTDDHSTQS